MNRYGFPHSPGKVISHGTKLLISFAILFFTVESNGAAPPLSDILPITGYYEQQGKTLAPRKLEKFLRLSGDTTVHDYADHSRAFRLSAGGIGATMWGINLGITMYQVSYLVRAIEDEEPISIPLANLAMPLAIGGQVASLTQGVLRNRSDFLLYKAAMANNEALLHRTFPDSSIDFRIDKLRYGWYRQSQLEMPEHVLYMTLRENEPSRVFANWSIFFRETAQSAYTVGGLFLFYAIMGFMESQEVKPEVRNMQLGVGIGCSAFGILTTVVSDIFKSRAIDRYNKTDRKRELESGIKEAE